MDQWVYVPAYCSVCSVICFPEKPHYRAPSCGGCSNVCSLYPMGYRCFKLLLSQLLHRNYSHAKTFTWDILYMPLLRQTAFIEEQGNNQRPEGLRHIHEVAELGWLMGNNTFAGDNE